MYATDSRSRKGTNGKQQGGKGMQQEKSIAQGIRNKPYTGKSTNDEGEPEDGPVEESDRERTPAPGSQPGKPGQDVPVEHNVVTATDVG